MIPYKDDNPAHHLPVVTYLLIMTNLLCWLLLQDAGNEPALSDTICNLGVIPGALLETIDPLNLGYCDIQDQTWVVSVTSMFMHASWIHLLGNMWFLWLFADNIEDVLRPVKFILFYLLGGLVAVASQLLADSHSNVPMVGASGAIGGVMGAYAWLYPTVRVRIAFILGFLLFKRHIPAWVMFMVWLGIQVVSAALAFFTESHVDVAFWAHIGGFLAGFFSIKLFYRTPPTVGVIK